jgi:hypothetical protein
MGCGISSKNIPIDQPKLYVPSSSIFGFEMEAKRRPILQKVKTLEVFRNKRLSTDPPKARKPEEFCRRKSTKLMSSVHTKHHLPAPSGKSLSVPAFHLVIQVPDSNIDHQTLLTQESPCNINKPCLKTALTKSTLGSNDSKSYIKIKPAEAIALDKSGESPSFEECENRFYEYLETNIKLSSS